MLAKYWITFLVFSVFPAPDSPLVKDGGRGERRWYSETAVEAGGRKGSSCRPTVARPSYRLAASRARQVAKTWHKTLVRRTTLINLEISYFEKTAKHLIKFLQVMRKSLVVINALLFLIKMRIKGTT